MFTNLFVQEEITNEYIIRKKGYVLTTYIHVCGGLSWSGSYDYWIYYNNPFYFNQCPEEILENPLKREQKLVFNMRLKKKKFVAPPKHNNQNQNKHENILSFTIF